MGNFLLILYFFINNFQIKISSSDEIINFFKVRNTSWFHKKLDLL